MEKYCLICQREINRGNVRRGSLNYIPKRSTNWLTCSERCSASYKVIASRIWGNLGSRIKQLEKNLRVLYKENDLRMKVIKEINNNKIKLTNDKKK